MLSKPTIAKNANEVAEMIAIRADWLGSVDLEQSARLAHAPRDRPHANANDGQQPGHLDTGENDVELDRLADASEGVT